MKGSARSVGALRMADLAEAMEERLVRGEPCRPEGVGALRAAVDAYAAALREARRRREARRLRESIRQ
ncbi:MAG: Hpt domain-containing protein [Burkholderiales bacterium]|nr:Hpt domain-containing protein [Burkholderiales bacterium]